MCPTVFSASLLLQPVLVLYGSQSNPDCEQYMTDRQLLGQVELPHLEAHPLLGLLINGACVGLPLQVLGDPRNLKG